jgi:hypothetical protein
MHTEHFCMKSAAECVLTCMYQWKSWWSLSRFSLETCAQSEPGNCPLHSLDIKYKTDPAVPLLPLLLVLPTWKPARNQTITFLNCLSSRLWHYVVSMLVLNIFEESTKVASSAELLVISQMLPQPMVKLSLCLTKYYAMKTWESGCIDLHFLNLDTNLWWVVSLMPLLLYPHGNGPSTHRIGGWVGPRTGWWYGEMTILGPIRNWTLTPQSSSL